MKMHSGKRSMVSEDPPLTAERTYRVLIEHDERTGSYVTYVPSLDWISTFGDTQEEALEHTVDLIQTHLALLSFDSPLGDRPYEAREVRVPAAC